MTHGRRLTWLCHGAMTTLALGLNLLPVFLVRIGRDLGGAKGLTGEELGRLGAMIFFGLVAGILVAGAFADRAGVRPFAVAGNALTAVGLGAMAAAPTYGTLAVALWLVGFAAGLLDMVLSPIVAALHPERRSSALNWLHSFYCVGAVVAIAVGTATLAIGAGWRGVGIVLMPLPAVLAVWFARVPLPPMGQEKTEGIAIFRSRWFLGALVAILLGGATELGMAQWLPAYAQGPLGFPEWVGGASLFAFSVAMALGRMVVGALPKADPYAVMAVGCGTSVVLFGLASFLPSPGWALAASVAVGFTGSALWPTMLAVAADRHPDGGATMYAALAAFGNAGGVLMPWLVGAVADGSGLRWGLATSALAPLLMLPLVLGLWRRRV